MSPRSPLTLDVAVLRVSWWRSFLAFFINSVINSGITNNKVYLPALVPRLGSFRWCSLCVSFSWCIHFVRIARTLTLSCLSLVKPGTPSFVMFVYLSKTSHFKRSIRTSPEFKIIFCFNLLFNLFLPIFNEKFIRFSFDSMSSQTRKKKKLSQVENTRKITNAQKPCCAQLNNPTRYQDIINLQ